MQKDFDLNVLGKEKALSDSLAFISSELDAHKLSSRERIRTELMCEEVLAKLISHADSGQLMVNVRKFLGSITISVRVPGPDFEFIPVSEDAVSDDDPDSAEAIQNLLLRTLGGRLIWRHSHGVNSVRILAKRSEYHDLYVITLSILLAVIAAASIRAFLPEEITDSINNIFAATRNIFMNGLKTCAVPIMFFSIVSCIADTGNLAHFKRIGVKLMLCILAFQFVAVITGFSVAGLFGVGKGAGLTASAASAAPPDVSVMDAVVDVMPSNIIQPFLNANMLQLLLLAFMLGTAISAANARSVHSVFSELSAVFMKVTGYLMGLMPVVAFCSIASMIITTGFESILSLASLLLALYAGYIMMHVIYSLAVKFIARSSPSEMYSKSMPAIITGMMTCSTATALPDLMKSSENLGISRELYSFAVPLCASVGRSCNCVFFSICVAAAANMYGITLTLPVIISIGVSAVLVNTASPGIPGAVLVSLSALLVQAGCPVEFIGLMMSINTLQDIFLTPTNCTGIIAAETIIDSLERRAKIV